MNGLFRSLTNWKLAVLFVRYRKIPLIFKSFRLLTELCPAPKFYVRFVEKQEYLLLMRSLHFSKPYRKMSGRFFYLFGSLVLTFGLAERCNI